MKYDINPEEAFTPLKPYNPHANCQGHKMSFLEDPMDKGADRILMLEILDHYFPTV